LSASSAFEAFRLLKINSPELMSDSELMDDALTLALRLGQALYDCVYLALALRRRCELVTADEKLCAAVQSQFPNVFLL
jgi:predicted nucleic acid-binding protein